MLLSRRMNVFLAATTVPTTTLLTDVPVMSAKDFENACKQPVIIGTVVSLAAMLPVNVIGMYALFTKLEKTFNPDRIMANQRFKKFSNRITKKK